MASHSSTKVVNLVKRNKSLLKSKNNHNNKIKSSVLQESFLILIPFLIGFYQLNQINIQLIHRTIPLCLIFSLFLFSVLISIYRHQFISPIYFKVTFTDQRGYRQSDQADDALSIAIGLPIIVCSALFLSSFHQLDETISHPELMMSTSPNPTHLMQIWNNSPQFFNSKNSHLLKFSHSDYLLSLTRARLDLISFTLLNLYALVFDLSLSILFQYFNYLPNNNSTRLIGSTLKSLLLSLLFALAVRLDWWGSAISQSMTPFECLFSVFTFQSSLYLTTRLARRAFTLAESCIFSSTSVALMIEVIRLTSARLRYSSYLLKQQIYPSSHPISDRERLSFLPSLFRFPSPAIAIQHVLVSGIFLMAFTLAPLLVLSRSLGQRPTKRHRLSSTRSPSHRRTCHSPVRTHSPSIHKPIWTSEPTQPDYYSRFSNPDSEHKSRQYASDLKENMRKVVALSIYASITWIALVVMSHWLGWLFEIGRNRTERNHEAWWKRIVGPGWMAFFSYSFLDLSYSDLETSSEKEFNLNKVSIRWIRVGMLVYWCICLMIGIGGWTGHLVRKRRSIRNPNRSALNDEQYLNKLVDGNEEDDDDDDDERGISTSINWKPSMSNFHPSHSIQNLTSSLLINRFRKVEFNQTDSKQIVNNSLDPSLSHNRNHRKWIEGVKQFFDYYYFKPHSNDQVESLVHHDCDGIKTKGEKQEEEGIKNQEDALIKEKRIIAKNQLQPTNSRPTSPALLLPSSSHNLSNGSSFKKEQLNLKRKFFHLLACLMFIPTIPLDIEFSSISFSVAFVIFTFCEFARYFAFYPIGAGIHLFFNEFIDSKDSGPVILSHFYLLTSCSTGIWLDGLSTNPTSSMITPSPNSSSNKLNWFSNLFLKLLKLNSLNFSVLQAPISTSSLTNKIEHSSSLSNHKHYHQARSSKRFGCKIEDLIGILVLGFGDTFASIIGNRIGKIKWHPSSHKTVEGSIGFIASVMFVSSVLIIIGFVQKISFIKYTFSLILMSLLEAFTNQNDNLILPLYSWSILKLLL